MNNWKEILKDEDKRKRYERYFAAQNKARKEGYKSKEKKREIISSVKRSQDFTDGFQEEAVSKRRVVKRKEDGLIVLHVERKAEQDHVEEKMLLREEKEDAALLVPLVKHTKEGREHHE